MSQKIVHFQYDSVAKKNDIALLKLSTPISFDSSKQPINISNKNTYSLGTTAIVSGWGQIDQYHNTGISQLRKANVTIASCK
ncbi:trypsin-like serine protease [Parabacteroides distasonis]|uniref:Trypsin-like serine protease n=1 Tax=Parabacteroides distasonis TaxID=823 RepID=A0A4S2ERD6_PARDI|nr:trypsin-like serine protease [Parabacteroides distasonis]